MPAAFYSAVGQPDWIAVARELRSDGLEPCYWIGDEFIYEDVVEAFPDVTFHFKRDAYRSIFPEELEQSGFELDSPTIAQYREYEENAIKMLGRLDGGHTFGYQERKRSYYRFLTYYNRLFDEHEPVCVIFAPEPHMISDYIMYIVATERDVPTYLATTTRIPGVCLISTSMESVSAELREVYDRLKEQPGGISLHSRVDEYLTEVAKTTDVEQHAPDPANRRIATPRKLLSVTKNLVAEYLSRSDNEGKANIARYYKRRDTTLESSGRKSPFAWALYDLKTHQYTKKLRQAYADRAISPTYDLPYVYVPLHYQPERATLPKGGVYDNQYLMVALIEAAVPDEWRIYVKEHPTQLRNRDSYQGRRTSLYEDLDALDSVSLVPEHTSTLKLIDNAMAVGTVTGTAGWEAVVRGTPAMTFGTAWYSACDGVYDVDTREDVEKAIDTIRRSSTVDEWAMRSFVAALAEVGYYGWLGLSEWPDDLTPEANAEGLTEAIREKLRDDGLLQRAT